LKAKEIADKILELDFEKIELVNFLDGELGYKFPFKEEIE